jgi:pimeloyl-ACP methyl ester carboxylesterase
MPTIRGTPPPPFRDAVSHHELELRGVRARAFQFPDGLRDPGRAIVCLAGMGADGRSFARLKPLAARWFLLPLNTPFDTPPGRNPLSFAADVVEEYLDSERLERPVLLGSSFGGAVAALVALRRPGGLRALVLANAVLARRQIPLAFPQFLDVLQAPAPLAQLVAPFAVQVMGGFALDRDARDEIVREARHFSPDELRRRLKALLALDLLERVGALALPTLAVHGSRDWLVPWTRGRWTAQAIPGARFALIRGAGHLPYLSHAKAFNRLVGDFLEEGGGPHPGPPPRREGAS